MGEREDRAERARQYMDKMRARAATGTKPMRLGQLIDALEVLPPGLPIAFDRGERVGPFDSWRGRYEMLTLKPNDGGEFWKCDTVRDLLRHAVSVDGDTREGYKGGVFPMDRSTFVWADEWGECPGRAVLGVEIRDGSAVIVTEVIDTDPAIWESF